jgi:hypothetical protein
LSDAASNPQDYGLPLNHSEWRAGQKEALDLILGMKAGSTLILEAPTGFGKSALASAVGHDERVLAMVATRDLQLQYADSYNFNVIWGRTHYDCTREDKVKRWLRVYGYGPTADDCSAMKECTTICPYKQAKSAAIMNNRAVMNYHYAWFSEWWYGRGGYLFCDEAHNLGMTTLSDLAQLRIVEKQRQHWGLPEFPACSGTADWAIQAVEEWLEQASDALKHTLQNTKDERTQSKGALLMRKLMLLTSLIRYGVWYVKGTNISTEPFLTCQPINPSVFAERLLGHQKRRVLMSATIGDAAILAEQLGITEYEFRSFPHNIDASRRPVYLDPHAPSMSHQSTWQDYELQADCIANICYEHKGERVLIHTTRWRHARDLASRLARKGLQDRVWVPEQGIGRIQQTNRLLDPSYTDMIAIGPSFWEGLDLRGDLCRAVVIAKVPYQDRSDPVVAARLRQPGGNRWDRWCAALKIVQGCGRAVRDAEDFATAYICDANWTRVAKLAPQWFEVQS